MTSSDRFQPVFAQLKQLLQPFEPRMTVEADAPEAYSLNTPSIAQLGKALFFGAVQIKKNYVSYHLMPVYLFPALLDNISPALKKRMQGKSCFNFTTLDQALLDELAQLTQRGYQRLKQEYAF